MDRSEDTVSYYLKRKHFLENTMLSSWTHRLAPGRDGEKVAETEWQRYRETRLGMNFSPASFLELGFLGNLMVTCSQGLTILMQNLVQTPYYQSPDFLGSRNLIALTIRGAGTTSVCHYISLAWTLETSNNFQYF